ncbi:glycerol-3-phosphate dehydrogenase/oxidase [Alteromonas gracilis]
MTGHLRIGPDHLPEQVDLLVVGLGVTGAGAALDAATRGLDVAAVEAFDLAWGTSRWSSKLVHGGLRYLARGQLDVAHESAVERDVLMRRTAPHLARTLPMLLPLTPDVSRSGAALIGLGLRGGDLLRRAARTPRTVLPGPRRLSTAEASAHAPALRVDGLRGALMSFDGQLVDDARLVVALARTATVHGARLHTRSRVITITPHAQGYAVRVLGADGSEHTVHARAVLNATGVWAGGLAPGIRLRPSRGTHLVLRAEALPGQRVALMLPVPGSSNRFLLVLPQQDGTVHVGLTDEETAEIPDVPEPSEAEIDWLLATVSRALDRPLTRDDVAGAYAGLRPLLDAGGATADISRRHAVITSPDGVVTVVGGKLTTYRRMAQDAVDAAVARHGLDAGPCRTRDVALLGAGPHGEDDLRHPRLVARYGSETGALVADAVRRTGLSEAEVTATVAPDVPVCLAELLWGLTHEGAASVEDLLERRTRISLTGDLERARPLAEEALRVHAAQPTAS